MTNKPQILLTNDDGIRSPGLWAAAEALSELGFVNVVAPRDQYSGAGRSLPSNSDGIIGTRKVTVHGKEWTVYSVGGTPAQSVLHAVYEMLPQKPALLVSGINYGENVGVGITVSGTVGAALEGAARGIPSLAISLETEQEHHLSYSTDVDFSAAAHFAALFGRVLLKQRMPEDVHVLKVDVPDDATPETPWSVTRLSQRNYFEPTKPVRESWEEPATVGYTLISDHLDDFTDSDIYALRVKRQVSVTPLSLNLTSRVDFGVLERLLDKDN
jgi:5'-nucleotidase